MITERALTHRSYRSLFPHANALRQQVAIVTVAVGFVLHAVLPVLAQSDFQPLLLDRPKLELPRFLLDPPGRVQPTPSKNPRYRACKQNEYAPETIELGGTAGFLKGLEYVTAHSMSCIWENTSGSAPRFDTTIVDIYQGKFEELNKVVKFSINKLEGMKEIGTKKKLDYLNYVENEFLRIVVLSSYATCKADSAPTPDYGCDTDRLKEDITRTNKYTIKEFNRIQNQNKEIKLKPYSTIKQISTPSELISHLMARTYEAIRLDPKIRFVQLAKNRYEELERLPYNEEIYVELFFEDGDPPQGPREVNVDISGQIVKITAYEVEANLFRTKTAFELTPDQAKKVSP